MKRIFTLFALVAAIIFSASCTKHWEGDFRGAPRSLHATTASEDGVIGTDGTSTVVITEPSGTLTIDTGNTVEYAIHWRVDGGVWSSAEGLAFGVPFSFPNLPLTVGTHVVDGEVYQKDAPEISYPFTFSYTITGGEAPITLAPTASNGAYILSGGVLTLSVEPTAYLKLVTGNLVEHDVTWKTDGGTEYSASGVKPGEGLDLTHLDTAPGWHIITGTVTDSVNPERTKDFTVSYDMGAAEATSLASVTQTTPGYLYYEYDIRDISQNARSYKVYSAPEIDVTKTAPSQNLTMSVSVSGGAEQFVSIPSGTSSARLDSAIVTKKAFGVQNISGKFYNIETSGRIASVQEYNVDYAMASVQTIESVTNPRVQIVKSGTTNTIMANASDVYVLDKTATKLILTSDFSFSGAAPYYPFMNLVLEDSSLLGFTYTGQKEQHVSTTSYPGVFGSYRKFTSVFYYFDMPSVKTAGTITLSFTDGVTVRNYEIKINFI